MQKIVPSIRGRVQRKYAVNKIIKTKLFLAIGLILLIFFVAPGFADDSAPYGPDKTSTGAIQAGTDSGVAEYTGERKPLPGWEYGKVRIDYWEHKDEKPLFTITSSNVDQYAEHLSPGQIAWFKTKPNYTMNVYPAHRECAFPDFVVKNTKLNADGRAKINASDGWSLEEAALPGIPFPFPDKGIQVIWNHIMRYVGGAMYTWKGTTYLGPPPGSDRYSYYTWTDSYWGPAQSPGTHSPKDFGGIMNYTWWRYTSPAALAGQAVVGQYYYDKDSQSFGYFPGQRRVRRYASYSYDAPLIGSENLETMDQIQQFLGIPDRYDWKIVGWKEMYVPYNCYNLYDYRIPLEEGMLKDFVNPKYLRYELHRVLEVEATIKEGIRHVHPKRHYYFDEDTWMILVAEDYDAKGNLWIVREMGTYPDWDINGTCVSHVQNWFYNVINGQYYSDIVMFGMPKDMKSFVDPVAVGTYGNVTYQPNFFTPEMLRITSER